MFKPPKIDSRRERIPVSVSARNEARNGMGAQNSLRSIQGTPDASIGSPAPEPAPALPNSGVSGPPAAAAAQEHSVKLSKATVQQIKLNLALLPAGAGNPLTIKQYLDMAHRLFEAHLRATGQLGNDSFIN